MTPYAILCEKINMLQVFQLNITTEECPYVSDLGRKGHVLGRVNQREYLHMCRLGLFFQLKTNCLSFPNFALER